MTGRLEGKSAIITGSARGIGRAFAEAYVREGATVAIADINIERAEQTAKEIGPKAYAVQLDVTDQASIDAAIRTVEAGYALTIMPQLPTDGTLGPHVVDGVLVLEPQPDDPRVAGLRRLNLPFVAVGDRVPDAHSVHAHEVDGARQLLDHLRSLGARSLGVLAPERPTASVQESLQALQDQWTLPGEEIVVERVPRVGAASMRAGRALEPTQIVAIKEIVCAPGRRRAGDRRAQG